MNAYIVISTPPSAEPNTKPSWIANLAIAALRRIVPAANPDFPDDLYERVTTWHVEIDSDSGEPLREVGLDSSGRVVVIGPWRDNYGCIVDSNVNFVSSEYPHVSADQFEQEWHSFHATNVAEPCAAENSSVRHAGCSRRPTTAAIAPHSAVAELGVVRRLSALSMSQYFPGKTTCSLCDVVLTREDDVVMFPAFVGDQSDPLWPFSDSTMHRRCFLAWPLRPSFIARYNREIGSITWGNGTYHQMEDDGRIVSLPRS